MTLKNRGNVSELIMEHKLDKFDTHVVSFRHVSELTWSTNQLPRS